MAGRYGYATYNNEMARRNSEQRRVPQPLSTAALIQGLQQGNLHNRFDRLMQPYRNDNRNTAHFDRLMKEAKNSENATKAKKGANNALKALKRAQRKAFGVNQNSSAGTTKSGKKKEMTAKKMKKKEKFHKIKTNAIAAMQRQQANNARNKERAVATNIGNLNMGGGPIVGTGSSYYLQSNPVARTGLELVSSASKANPLPSAPNYNSNNNSRALIASLPTVPTHNVSKKNTNNNKKKKAVAVGGRRKTRKHKRRHKKRRKTRNRKHKKRRKHKTRRRRR